MKAAIGIIIILLSFGYILKNPGKSMMENLMESKRKKYDEALAQAQAEQAARAAQAVQLDAPDDSPQNQDN